MQKRITKLTEPSMRLYFAFAVLFALAAFFTGETVLGIIESVVVFGLYLYFRSFRAYALPKQAVSVRDYRVVL